MRIIAFRKRGEKKENFIQKTRISKIVRRGVINVIFKTFAEIYAVPFANY